ncbi:MAG: BamA/TamA family outer membrane protein [Casimicrobiaceae bacterium]
MASTASIADDLAAQPAEVPAATIADATEEASIPTFRYSLVIAAPGGLSDVLAASVGLARWRDYADMTEELFDQLARESVVEAREAAATEGYFSAIIDITVDRTVTPALVTLHVEEGEPTRVAAVDIKVTGPAASDVPAGAEAIAKLRDEWLLPTGTVFRQIAWDSAKTRAVATLAASPYAAASVSGSAATIDPERRAADLAVEIASGPPFRFGPIEVTGLSRYSESLVRNYNTIVRGAPYSTRQVEDYARRLNNAGYFASVQAAIDTDPATAADAPLRIGVIEAPRRRIEAGVGYSTDVQYRANISYRDFDVDGAATQFIADARYDTLEQSASLRLVRPPNEGGWQDSVFGRIEHTDVNDLVTRTAGFGVRRASIEERDQWQFGAAMLYDEQFPLGADSAVSHALYLDVERAWRRTDDLLSPTRGWVAIVQGGGGVPGVSTRGFGRVIVRAQGWLPLSRDNDLTARLEGGAVLAGSRVGVPSTLLFRTGGETTVRGYKFESLGVQDGEATVGGRYFAIGSVEVTHWFSPVWGIAAFVDGGNAVDQVSDFKIAWGYGLGARIRTPIGPFRFDVAYGQETRQVRLQFSVGVSF